MTKRLANQSEWQQKWILKLVEERERRGVCLSDRQPREEINYLDGGKWAIATKIANKMAKIIATFNDWKTISKNLDGKRFNAEQSVPCVTV